MNLSRLNWDSDFFGLNIGKLVLSDEDDFLMSDISGLVDYDLVYIFANHGRNMPVIGANLVDCKVIYKKSISRNVEANSNVRMPLLLSQAMCSMAGGTGVSYCSLHLHRFARGAAEC